MYQTESLEKFNNLHKNYKTRDIFVLGIESSCDETSVAIIKNGDTVLSNVISSQVEIHKRFGGVVPEVASRNHVLAIDNVLNEALAAAQITLGDIHAIAVTYGAGLMGALMVGVNFAKSLAYALNIPLIKVNHIYSHIAANNLQKRLYNSSYISLVVSGGHTALIKITRGKYTVIGSTYDDAIGEAYDKVAKVLGLGYPGGPQIDKLAKTGENVIPFITKIPNYKNFNFSYSGLKTTVINYIHKQKQNGEELNIPDICASFQTQAMNEVITKAINACLKHKIKTLAVAGGVAANSYLREHLTATAKKYGITVLIPPINLCTDNAAMVALEGYNSIIHKTNLAGLTLTADPNINLKFLK